MNFKNRHVYRQSVGIDESLLAQDALLCNTFILSTYSLYYKVLESEHSNECIGFTMMCSNFFCVALPFDKMLQFSVQKMEIEMLGVIKLQ